jgi:hypothetical protein
MFVMRCSLQKIPDYFLRKVAGYPGGIRLTKMVKYNQSGYSYLTPGFRGMGCVQGGDPLAGGDYRYWAGTPHETVINKGFSRCRGCGVIKYTKLERKEHKNEKCGAYLERAYKVMRRRTDCVICGENTNKKVYGLAMCCNECVNEWELVTSCPLALLDVLDQIKKEDKNAKS